MGSISKRNMPVQYANSAKFAGEIARLGPMEGGKNAMGKQIAFVQRLADAAQGIPIVRLLWHDLEAHLPEVLVQRQRPANLQLAHKGKTAAVGEGEILVAIAEEERTCPFCSRFVDGLDSQSRRAIDLQPPGFCGIETKPKPDCGQCFVDHVIGRRQQAAGHQPLIPGFPHRRQACTSSPSRFTSTASKDPP